MKTDAFNVAEEAIVSPQDLLDLLGQLADMAHESGETLTSAWQDKNAGDPWFVLANSINAAIRSAKRNPRFRTWAKVSMTRHPSKG